MESTGISATPPKRHYVVAVVLGTVLSALGPTSTGAAEVSPTTRRAITDVSRYCTVCWRNARLHPDSWPDCTQEVFRRLLERVPPESWDRLLKAEGEERREFLRAIDAVKKRGQRSRPWSGRPIEAVADPRDAQERRLADDREAVRQAASKLLSPRQQRILRLSLEGWAVQDMAAELGIAADRVSDEKYKAIRKLRQHFGPDGDEADRRSGQPPLPLPA